MFPSAVITSSLVIPGLVPGTHVFETGILALPCRHLPGLVPGISAGDLNAVRRRASQDVGARDEPGHDAVDITTAADGMTAEGRMTERVP